MIKLTERIINMDIDGPANELAVLKEALRFKHPKAWHSLKHQLYVNSGGKQGWDGYICPMKRLNVHKAEILRGFKTKVLDILDKAGIELDQDSRLLASPFKDITTADIPDDIVVSKHTLDENQRAVIVAWLQNGMGIGKMAVNAGKTMTTAGFAAMLKAAEPKVRILYITDRERLVTQSYGEMRKFLPTWEISKFGGGDNDESGKDMVVCTIAMLRKHLEDLRAVGWFSTFIAVIMDECHHASSESAKEILQEFKGAFFRIGCSDTVKIDDPIKHNDIVGLLGPILATVHQSTLIESGRSAIPHIYLVDHPNWKGCFERVSYRPAIGSKAWVLLDGESSMRGGKYLGPVYERNVDGVIKTKKSKILNGTQTSSVDVPATRPGLHAVDIGGLEYEVDSSFCLLQRSSDVCIVNFKDRNNLIVDWTKHFAVDKNKRTLVVATRTVHILILEAMLLNSPDIDSSKVKTLVGEDTSSKRNKVFAWFKATPGAILISPLVKEGVSINEIEAGVIADYVGDHEVFNQLVGRFIRKKEGENVAEMVSFVDRQQTRFEKGSTQMLKQVQKIKGYVFYWPCIAPGSEDAANIYDSTAEIEFSLDYKTAQKLLDF